MQACNTTGGAAVVNDGDLEQLAAEPAQRLFPLLNHAGAMVPLVVVLAFLPPLFAIAHRSLSEQGAWQGLAVLTLLSSDGSRLETFSGVPQIEQLQFQPPLTAWLTAPCMKAFGSAGGAGLVTAPYLLTAGLLLAAYMLGRRLGEARLGLVAVLLLSFHPQILEGARQPSPQSCAVLCAVLALAGVVAHWQKSASVVSYQLLLAGIALGFCLLAGGPAALAVVAIVLVYVVWWKLAARHRDRSGIDWDRSRTSRRTALRSLLVLAATGFAVGGWYLLLSSSRYGRSFWSEWFVPAAISGATTDSAPRAGLAAVAQVLHRLCWPVYGLTAAGLITMIRDAYCGVEDPARRHRLILVVWIGTVLAAWSLAGGAQYPNEPSVKVWEALLVVPLMLAAALGLLEIAERRIGFLPALAAGILPLADAALLNHAGPATATLAAVDRTAPGLRLCAAGLLIGGAGVAWLAQRHEGPRRTVLAAMLAVLVAGHCLWGAWNIRETNDGDRDLDELRSLLSRMSQIERTVFVPLSRPRKSAPELPPARLIYGVASLWPTAPFTVAPSWDKALAPAGAAAGADRSTLFVAWAPRGPARGTAPDPSLKPAAPPILFEGLEVVVYLRDRPRAALADDAERAAAQRRAPEGAFTMMARR